MQPKVSILLCTNKLPLFSDVDEWADKVFRRFNYLRDDYHKIVARGKAGTSGSKSKGQLKPLTALQQWKLTKYSFLEDYYRPSRNTSKDSKESMESRSRSRSISVPGSTLSDRSEVSTAEGDDMQLRVGRANPVTEAEDFGFVTSPPPITSKRKRVVREPSYQTTVSR